MGSIAATLSQHISSISSIDVRGMPVAGPLAGATTAKVTLPGFEHSGTRSLSWTMIGDGTKTQPGPGHECKQLDHTVTRGCTETTVLGGGAGGDKLRIDGTSKEALAHRRHLPRLVHVYKNFKYSA
jgi:hypothetical protein